MCRHNVQLWCSDGLVSSPWMFGLVCFTIVSILLCMDDGLRLHICISGSLSVLISFVAVIIIVILFIVP